MTSSPTSQAPSPRKTLPSAGFFVLMIGCTALGYAAVDRGESDANEHAAWLSGHIDGFPDGFRQAIALELALHQTGLGDIEASRHWMARAKGGVVDASRRALAEASLARLVGDPEGSHRLLGVATAKLSRGMDPGLNVLTAEQIGRTQAMMDSHLAPPPGSTALLPRESRA